MMQQPAVCGAGRKGCDGAARDHPAARDLPSVRSEPRPPNDVAHRLRARTKQSMRLDCPALARSALEGQAPACCQCCQCCLRAASAASAACMLPGLRLRAAGLRLCLCLVPHRHQLSALARLAHAVLVLGVRDLEEDQAVHLQTKLAARDRTKRDECNPV